MQINSNKGSKMNEKGTKQEDLAASDSWRGKTNEDRRSIVKLMSETYLT